MDCKRLPGLILGLLLLSVPAYAQYSDYDWARGLTREFGFDDMAETVFQDLVGGKGRTKLERQQGQLGLAEMKQLQARRTKDLKTKLDLFDEARKLSQAAVKGWPEKNTNRYYQAIFALVDLLQERGEAAMKAVNAGGLSEADATRIQKDAESDYGRAETELERIKSTMGNPEPETDRAKWRIKNAGWYRLCLLKYNKALTGKAGSSKRLIPLTNVSAMLEDYILENETEDEEARIGAFYGYLLMGQVRAKLDDPSEAKGNFSSVIDQVFWEGSDVEGATLHPMLQQLVEQAYYLLFDFLIEQEEYDAVVKYGVEMEARFKRMDLSFKKLGRAARVKLAEARLRLGDMNGALRIAAEVVESARGDASGTLANQLVAEVITATPDKSQFSPDIIRSAAKGAFSQGGEKRYDAIRYFQIFLQILDKIPDEATRKYQEADAWFYMGRAYYFMNRRVEAAMVFAEGAKRCKDVKKDDLGEELARLWRVSLLDVVETTGSKEARKLLDACNNWFIANPMGQVAPGTILYKQALRIESAAKSLRGSAAIGKYEEAARKYGEAVAKGGPKKEQAMIKRARTGLKVAELQFLAKQTAPAKAKLETAKAAFMAYIKYAEDPTNKLTDPKYQSSRDGARAEARYSIARSNRLLMKIAGDPEITKTLWKETLPYLIGFEKTYRRQRGMSLAMVSDRVRARLSAGDIPGAEADYAILKGLDPQHPKTAYSAVLIGQALRPAAKKAFEAIVGTVTPTNPASWAKVSQKSGFEPARQSLKRVYSYYREWLLAGEGQPEFKSWDLVCWMWGRIGEVESSSELHRKALARFEGMSSAPAARILIWKNRLLHANVGLAKKADAAGQSDVAVRLWNEAGQMAEALLKVSKYSRNPLTVRLAAEVFGGYVATKGGLPVFYANLGRFDKAQKLWSRIEKSLRAQALSGTSRWWEAKFYLYHVAYLQDKDKRHDLKGLRRKLDALQAAYPEFGGDAWRPFFEWLARNLY